MNGVSFDVGVSEIVGIVGESGSGKSTIAMSIMQLHDPGAAACSGEVVFGGQNLLNCTDDELRKVRGPGIGMIFQDPQSSLNPVQKIGHQVLESSMLHNSLSRPQAKNAVIELIDKVGIPEPDLCFDRYPHELSGGMKQRIMISIAIASNPKLLIADEPTTALDVTVQAQILELIRALGRSHDMSVLFISHDLAVISQLCDRVIVMRNGEIVETATTAELFRAPKEDYTKMLLQAAALKSRNQELAERGVR
ncbi:ABC transporter ATP-binding protein [Microbacterium sp. MPKO10]|uniref:ABC transporter ATP-binding protein n=1 Tax=Microbacterium sp. MPKO10 TaxID=2989818 RepID=UPI002235D95A|nr:ABC transporter ATP-binding protein [Microbacterium sp. MPKO10]MCW4459848.1 ABC transporter ATP-binding protein [Microbacterium sp. MPKO10]